MLLLNGCQTVAEVSKDWLCFQYSEWTIQLFRRESLAFECHKPMNMYPGSLRGALVLENATRKAIEHIMMSFGPKPRYIQGKSSLSSTHPQGI